MEAQLEDLLKVTQEYREEIKSKKEEMEKLQQ
jgi:hypothetical protein